MKRPSPSRPQKPASQSSAPETALNKMVHDALISRYSLAAILYCWAFIACRGDPLMDGSSVGSSSHGAPASVGSGGSDATGGVGGLGGGGGAPLPPFEVTQCPGPNASDAAINTAIVVHSADVINAATVTPWSLRAIIDGADVIGTLDVDPHNIAFIPETALPPNQFVQVVLAPTVLDTNGRSLADEVSTWEFSTSNTAVSAPGLTFSQAHVEVLPELKPVILFAMVMDGEYPIFAWAASAGGGLSATSFDGTGFPPPINIEDDFWPHQLTMARGAASVHFGSTYFDGPGTIVYNRAAFPFGELSTEPVGLCPASYAPKIAADNSGRVAIVWSTHPILFTAGMVSSTG